jgi:manganese/iron transport system permease protein
MKWKDLMVVFFDENHARSIGLNPANMNLLFFTILSACCVAALQTVGAFLVIAMVITPGATAYLLTDRFPHLLIFSTVIGTLTSFFGAYASFFFRWGNWRYYCLLADNNLSLGFFVGTKAWDISTTETGL